MDWYKAPRSAGGLGALFVYTIELRGDGDPPGFLLPAFQIIFCGQELWAAERVVYKKMIQVSNSGRGVKGHSEDEGAVVEGQDVNGGDGVLEQDGGGVTGHSLLSNTTKSNQAKGINQLFEALIESFHKN